jgi:hypothetical protein
MEPAGLARKNIQNAITRDDSRGLSRLYIFLERG